MTGKIHTDTHTTHMCTHTYSLTVLVLVTSSALPIRRLKAELLKYSTSEKVYKVIP